MSGSITGDPATHGAFGGQGLSMNIHGDGGLVGQAVCAPWSADATNTTRAARTRRMVSIRSLGANRPVRHRKSRHARNR